MLGHVAHIGITVRDMDKALAFYRDLLGLKVVGDVTVTGEKISRVTQVKGATVRAVYVRSGEDLSGPPLELLHFIEPAGKTGVPYAGLINPGISQVAFWVKDIEKRCADLRVRGVELYSEPQLFDIE